MSAADAPVVVVDASLAPERREARRYLALLLPAVLVLLALFVYPLLGIADRSVYKPRVGYTLDYYAQIWRVPVYLTVIWRTFQTSALESQRPAERAVQTCTVDTDSAWSSACAPQTRTHSRDTGLAQSPSAHRAPLPMCGHA